MPKCKKPRQLTRQRLTCLMKRNRQTLDHFAIIGKAAVQGEARPVYNDEQYIQQVDPCLKKLKI